MALKKKGKAAPAAAVESGDGRERTRRSPDQIAQAAPLEQDYTPTQTSLKASFRVDGRDQQSDQDVADSAADNRWNDEDRYTNHSGDPRIGTHRRSCDAANAPDRDKER